MLLKKYILLFFCLVTLDTFAQSDSVILLRAVQINSIRSTKNIIGLKTEKTDSLMKLITTDQSIGNYLTEYSPSLVKNYGPGALSSVSLRGGSAYHTAVLWKGFSLANPMNGVMDFNLLPTFLFDDISIQYGGSSSVWGSGAISGSILLNSNNILEERNSIKLGSRYNSASGWTNYADARFAIKRFNSSIKLFLTDEKNAFSFHQNNELKKQVHAEAKGRGIISENNYSINANTILSFNFWHQFADRNIAPVLTESISNAKQRDRNFRYNLTFSKEGLRGKFIFRNAYFDESLYYNDSSLKVPSNSLCKTFISEPEYSYKINENHSFQTGLNFTSISAIATEFKEEALVIRKAIYLAYQFRYKKINLSLSGRKEFTELKSPPLAYTGGFNYDALKWLRILGSYSSVYRNPQVNDLYWQPGGNIHLLPETGISYEGTLEFNLYQLLNKRSSDTNAFTFQFTTFNKNIDNWIAWTPHGMLWTPSNIKSVHSYGTESTIMYKRVFSKFALRISGFHGYTVSETTTSELAFDASIGKQLIYVPYHKAGGTISFYYKKSILTFNHTYTGIRYTTTDNSGHLPAYKKSNVQFDQQFIIGHNSLNVFVRAENVFDIEYQSVLNRPEPLRNFSFGISLTYHKTKKI